METRFVVALEVQSAFWILVVAVTNCSASCSFKRRVMMEMIIIICCLFGQMLCQVIDMEVTV